ncbi:Glycosyltransferase involved in cell wall bisynthesis [Chitinophaga jiangningensis]|uniref:Glycosyltransferase involved in cell wall bisynthesis n=1 Tax=Chitinophaga jiangningensis TaxID=1419482 RepID=A0A1M7E293_9BACT|nr:glycosyltransferase family 1 protein [Chitinophaga jiangningensis]SHL85837.1 Glycosyltransferase involved in cell wall bisynthesis [Chitinophaga jiangningensis]
MAHYVFDCERMKYPNTGLHTYCLELGKAMLQQLMPSEEMSFFVNFKQKPDFGPGAKYLEQKLYQKYFMPYRDHYDVWHSTYQTSRYKPGNSKTNRILTIHDLNFLYEAKTDAKRKKLLKQVQDTVNSSRYVIAISAFAKNDVEQHLDLGNTPIKVIHNGINVAEFPGYDAPPYKPAKPFIFAIGTVIPKKNFHVLPCLLQHNDYELVIAGSIRESYLSEIMREAAFYGVTDRVKVIGPVKDEDKYWYLKNCTAFAFPSLAEGFGIPPIEAMHFGKPVFLSDKTSLPEIGGDAAYYFRTFEPADMQRVFAAGMHHYQETMPVERIKAHANQFCWKNAASQYLEIYRTFVR